MARALSVLALVVLSACFDAHADTPCSESELHVDTQAHTLSICHNGRTQESFRVRIGSAGTGKRHEGDQRTPLGVYALGQPRVSQRFHVFIPIAYPTQEQQRAGFTGGNVGIHGTSSTFTWLGALTAYFDTTDGCIAVASDEEIERIATWVRVHPHANVRID